MKIVWPKANRAIGTFLVAFAGLGFVSGSVLADEGGDPVLGNNQHHATGEQSETVRLLFIHHSCGGHLMADPGEAVGGEKGSGEHCLLVSHPYGGGLRSRLEDAGYEVHQLTYESVLGADTDICHWHGKFANHMAEIVHTDRQDRKYAGDGTNQIVAFKSCYPNNQFIGDGTEPGDPDSCERTLANARAAYRALLPHFEDQPEVLFVAFTAPPLAERKPVGIKATIKSWFKSKPKWADLAREFNTWMVDRDNGWLAEYPLANVVVFDHYDILTNNGETNWSAYATQGGSNSHPSSAGNQKSAEAFMPFINTAYRTLLDARAGQTTEAF